jgi:pyridoxine 5-phosphate synthase
MTIHLGVNIDHVATLRNVRGTTYPDPVEAALVAEKHGASGITAHLREDRRHITDADIRNLKAAINTRLNMEMANTDDMVAIALKTKPYMVTLVPERREELTTEGGLDVAGNLGPLTRTVQTLQDAGIDVSLFIEASEAQLEASKATGAKTIEFHTGHYCELYSSENSVETELIRLHKSAKLAVREGLIVNAGHGLTRHNVKPILDLAGLHELNIGHAIVADAVMHGFGQAVEAMHRAINH